MNRGDEIWEHKRGKIWKMIERMEKERRALIYANAVLRARVSRLARELEAARR